MDLSWPPALAAVLGGGYGAASGGYVARRLATGAHRRYADERARSLPSYRLLVPLCALTCAALAWRLAPAGWGAQAAYAGVVPLYAALAAVDLDVHRLPDRLTWPAVPAVAALLGVASVAAPPPVGWGEVWARAGLAGVATWAAFAALHVISRGRLGRGDVKLAGPLGALLGWFSWAHVLGGVYAMFLVGGLVALWMVAWRRAGRHARLAFGPAMILGALLGVLVGSPLPA